MTRYPGLVFAFLFLVAGPASGADTPLPGDNEPVIGISFRGSNRAYPLSIFLSRRILNDVVESQEVVIFHDPTRNLSVAWFRTLYGEPIEFSEQVAGTQVEDLTTITRWDMSTGKAVGGNLVGQKLVPLPITIISWSGWLAKHPDTNIYSQRKP